MKIGIPLEIKPFEKRVALLPAAVAELTAMGHTVFLQSGAGAGSGYDDMAYTAAGAKIVADAESLYAESVLIVKVKEPVTAEYAYLRQDHRIFSFLHLAANPELANQLQKTGLTAIAFETLMVDNSLPLLAPMSDVAGRISVQAGANYLFSHHGGKGLLLGGRQLQNVAMLSLLAQGMPGAVLRSLLGGWVHW